MVQRELNEEEFEHIARLLRGSQTVFENVNWAEQEILGKGRITLIEEPIYKGQTLMEKVFNKSSSEQIGVKVHEGYDVVFLLNPFERISGLKPEEFRLYANTTFSANMHRKTQKLDDEIKETRYNLYGPNNEPQMSYDFRPETIVFPLKMADISEIFEAQRMRH